MKTQRRIYIALATTLLFLHTDSSDGSTAGGGLVPLLNFVQPRAVAPFPPSGLQGFTPELKPQTKLWETAVPTTDANGNVWNYERVEGVEYLRSIDVNGVPDAMKGTITMTDAPPGQEAASKYETPNGDILVMQGTRGKEYVVSMDVGLEWLGAYIKYDDGGRMRIPRDFGKGSHFKDYRRPQGTALVCRRRTCRRRRRAPQQKQL